VKHDLFVIVNPTAGGGRAAREQATVAEFLRARGRTVEFHEAQGSRDLREQAARAAADGYSCILALGGDGTFHYLVEALAGTNAVVGFLPAGNGNDTARALGIPRDPVRAADALLRSEPRWIDLIRARLANGRITHCVCSSGVGLDAEAAHLANTRFRRWPGLTRYLAGAVLAYGKGAAFELSAQIDGAPWGGPALLAVVANAPEYGAGIRIASSAKLDDGRIDLVLVRPVAWPRFIEAMATLWTSGDLRFSEVERFRCRRVGVETDRSMKVHGDGEILGESPVEFEVVPGAIRVMAPKFAT
jgi:diacylglycerol kinase (ATP)